MGMDAGAGRGAGTAGHGVAYLFPTFTMRVEADLEPFDGLAEQVTDAWHKVARAARIDAHSVPVAARGQRLSAHDTLLASYATLAEGLACARWAERHLRPATVATSFSMGLYAALVYTEALSLEPAIALLGYIHELAAARQAQSATFSLGAVMGPTIDEVRAALPQPSGLELSVDYGERVCLVCGPSAEVEEFCSRLAVPPVRTLVLPVAVPFHTSRLNPLQAEIEARVAATPVQPPRIPVVSSSNAEVLTSTDAVRRELVRNIAHPIHWKAAVDTVLGEGATEFVECGFTRELGDLLRRDRPHLTRIHQFAPSNVEPDSAASAGAGSASPQAAGSSDSQAAAADEAP